MKVCPQCGGQRVEEGLISIDPKTGFRPGPRRFLSASLRDGVQPESLRFQACLDCGLLWGRLNPDKLRRYIRTQCNDKTREKWGLSEVPKEEIDPDWHV